MNKTVNINLGGTFFHIDEDAYQKLSRYFEAIKKHLSDSDGKDEIIRDIEIRISELFSEKLKSDKQVISMKDLDEVITIMGEPEDYRIDDDQQPKSQSYQKSSKKLYRDPEGAILGGVLAGLGHYFGIDKVWIRIIFALLFIFYGTGFLLYIILWIIMPEAKTTSEKLEMKGEAVNISSIEKKVREEFGNLSEKVNNIDYEKYGNKVKSGAENFGNSLGNFFTGFFKIIGKIIGVFIIIFSIAALASLIITLITLGSTEFFQLPWMGISEAFNYSEVPIWVLVILFLFSIGIPFLALLILGFRILISNSKPLGNMFKYSMFGIWIISIIALVIVGVRQATEIAFEEKISHTHTINIQPTDTLQINLTSNQRFESHKYSEFRLVLDENDNETIYSSQVRYYIQKTKETQPYVIVNKIAGGNSLINAKQRAEEIRYNIEVKENQIFLEDYLLADLKSKYRNQAVNVEIYIPENIAFYLEENMKHYWNRFHIRTDEGASSIEAEHLYVLEKNTYKCLDCVSEEEKEEIISENETVINDTISETTTPKRLKVAEDGTITRK